MPPGLSFLNSLFKVFIHLCFSLQKRSSRCPCLFWKVQGISHGRPSPRTPEFMMIFPVSHTSVPIRVRTQLRTHSETPPRLAQVNWQIQKVSGLEGCNREVKTVSLSLKFSLNLPLSLSLSQPFCLHGPFPLSNTTSSSAPLFNAELRSQALVINHMFLSRPKEKKKKKTTYCLKLFRAENHILI